MARSQTRVRTLIDGYNLLHVTDAHGHGALAGTLQGARETLLDQLASRLTRRQRENATIVFDAAGAPPGLPAESSREGIRVLFARDYPDADAMLEALIESDPAPKELLVVSGDRRVQRAARRRGAAWEDSDAWRQAVLRRQPRDAPRAPAKPSESHGVGDTEYWVGEFSKNLPAPEDGPSDAPPPGPLGEDPPSAASPAPPEPKKPAGSSESPFPPGYAEDLAEELEKPDRPRPEGG